MMNSPFRMSLLNRKQLGFILLCLLILGSICLAFLFAPERTNDGLVHLFWNSFWSDQIKSGDLFPKWHAQGYGGYGNPAFLFYPPLLKYVALPYHLLGFSPNFALRLTVATILIINIISASILAGYLLKKRSLLYYNLIIILAINPYLFYCLFWRGALAECLAIALIPLFLVAVLKVSKRITFAGGLQLSITTSLIVLAHLPTLIILFFLFSISSIITLLKDRKIRDFGGRILFFVTGIVLSLPYLGPVFLNLTEIRQPTAFSIHKWFVFSNNFYESRHTFLTSLIFSIYLIIYILSIRAVFKQHKTLEKFDSICLLILPGLALFMTSPFSFPLYKLIFPLQKIQFPFRFLVVASSLIAALALFSLSLNFQKSKKQLFAIVPIIISLCIPHYFLLSNVLTSNYQNSLPKQQFNSLITERVKNPSYQPIFTGTSKSVPVKQVEIGGKKFNLASGFLIVPDVPDYLPSTPISKSKTSFWRFQGNTVYPTKDYQDHYVRNGNGRLNLIEASLYSRLWECEVVSNTQVDLGISYFRQWNFETEPKGMIRSQGVSENGLFTLQLQPGKYQLIGQYTDRLSWLFWLFPVLYIALLVYFKLVVPQM